MSEDDFFADRPDLLTIRYNAWTDQFPIKDSKVLDLGCNYATAGEYFLQHGASKYVGVDLDENMLASSQELLESKFDNLRFSLIKSSINKFLDNNDETFDIVLLGVVIHGAGDIIELFRKVSQITNRVVIETAHPFYTAYRSTLDLLSTDELYNLEYASAVAEAQEDSPTSHLNFLYSMKYLSIIFNRLGFIENYDPYERMKTELPKIYGFDLTSRLGLAKRYMIILNKKQLATLAPVTWEELF
jgi:SAM-dependent methyltransferase